MTFILRLWLCLNKILSLKCSARPWSAALSGEMASSHLQCRKQINLAEQPGRNTWRTYWNDSPDVIKMPTIAIKEVKIKRDLEKEVGRAGDLELLSHYLRACATTGVQTCIEGHLCPREEGKKTRSEIIVNCKNSSEVEINSPRICLIKTNKSTAVVLL